MPAPSVIPSVLTLFAGATPISHFLGAIVSGSQGALTSSAREMNLQVGHVKWHATGKYDVRGVRGEEVCLHALMRASKHSCSIHESTHEIMCRSIRPLLPSIFLCCYANLHAAQAIRMCSCTAQGWILSSAIRLSNSTNHGSVAVN